MLFTKEHMLLYAVTDRSWLGEKRLIDQVEEVLKAGATLIQLREKDLSYEEFVSEAIQIKAITDYYHIPLIINDRIDVAIAADADGVHLGQDDDNVQKAREILGSDKIIGISAHTVREALDAEKYGADYIGVGAVFGTTTKKDAGIVTFETLKDICKAVTIPVVAIGGITGDNIMKLAGSGVAGVAVISALFASKDPGKATKKMYKMAAEMVAVK